MEFRRQWLNYILRKSSEVYYLKKRLLVVHGMTGLKLLIMVWLLEIQMGIVSFPIFLFLKIKEVPEKEQREYRLRRTITVLILFPLAAIWLARFGIWAIFELGTATHNFSEGPNQGFSVSSTGPWQDLYFTVRNDRLMIPHFSTSTSDMIVVEGHSEPNKFVIVSFQKQDAGGAISLLEVPSDAAGIWKVERQKINIFPTGKYMVSAVTFDNERKLKSAPSPSIPITIPLQWWQRFEQLTDFIIYGTIGLLILLAIIMSFLTF
jgi:hypothetical protein